MNTCKIEGCGAAVVGHGWCHKHWKRWRRNGDPLAVKVVQHHGLSVKERFWINVKQGAGCWEWQSYKDPNGYGRLNIGNVPKLAHRLSYEIEHNVTLSPSDHVCHSCDNPRCVRPSHLFLGDHAANTADKMAKGRHVYGTSKGEAHGCAKLDERQVREIRSSREKGVTLAAQYGVSTTQISDIRNRRVWKHLD